MLGESQEVGDKYNTWYFVHIQHMILFSFLTPFIVSVPPPASVMGSMKQIVCYWLGGEYSLPGCDVLIQFVPVT